MSLTNVLPLVILALSAGIYTAKLFLKQAAERLANEFYNSLQEEEKTPMQ